MDKITAVQAKVNSIIIWRRDIGYDGHGNGYSNGNGNGDGYGNGLPQMIRILIQILILILIINTLKIEEMEDTFDLVMVAERWDESMVLLKNLLCWEFRSR